MRETLGTIIFDGDEIILEYNDGHEEIFVKDKPNYSEGSQWITIKEERYFLKQS